MRRHAVALITVVALSAGLGACGSDDEVSGEIPRTTPDLTIPTATSDAPATETTTTPSTTTTTPTTPGAGAAPPAASGGQSPATPPAAPQGSPKTGGATPQGQSTTGGAQAGGGEFENFCSQNPGAC